MLDGCFSYCVCVPGTKNPIRCSDDGHKTNERIEILHVFSARTLDFHKKIDRQAECNC